MAQKVELLAPARDAEIGIEAFRHGADAVYIGAPKFSARAAAGNSLTDIERMASFGHQYGARTLVAFNTILRDSELEEAQRLTWQLYDAGVDALIVQDLGLLGLDLPPIQLHASTQTDNRTIEKVRLMHQLGFTRVVVARELSIAEIRAIHQALPDVELECFVHGALCVCVSGQCYLSAALTGRSANRGECAQPCRLPMDLIDGNGKTVIRQKHLLSLRDMNRSLYLRELIDAGVYSLKIEGRLKDMSYVKNVVAYYRTELDRILGEDSHVVYTFVPDPAKSFNRGFTSCYVDGNREVMWNFDSPKSMGESIGRVTEVGPNWFRIKGIVPSNGDGLVCDKTLGFRANRVDEHERVFPLGGPDICRQLRQGMEVRRNLDSSFEQLLKKPSADRRVPVDMHFVAKADELELIISREACCSEERCLVSVKMPGTFEKAQKPQSENIRRQVSKLGDSIYQLGSLTMEGEEFFVPSSMLSQLRREGVSALDEKWQKEYERCRKAFVRPDYMANASGIEAAAILPHDYKANVLNRNAREIYRLMGVCDVTQAFENHSDGCDVVMQTKFCLRQALGKCPKNPLPEDQKMELSTLSLQEPWMLKIGNEKFILKFGCKNLCNSEIFRTFAHEK